MNKTILAGFVVALVVLLGGALAALASLSGTTEKLDQLAMLHEVEVLREDLVIRIEQVQSYISRNKIRSGGDVDALNARIQEMDQAIDACLGCHHSPERTQGLLGMRDVAADYTGAIRRLATASADTSHAAALERRAEDLGRDLLSMTRGMAFGANTGLQKRTREAVQSLRGIRRLLAFSLVLGSALAALAAVAAAGYVKRALAGTIAYLQGAGRAEAQRHLDLDTLPEGGFRALGAACNALLDRYAVSGQRRVQDARHAGAAELAGAVSGKLDKPLAGALKDAEELLSSSALSAEGKERLHAMKRHLQLCRDLTVRLRAFAPKGQLLRVKTDIAALARDAVMQAQQEAQGGRISLAFDCPADLPSLAVDVERMKLVFSHLTRNAFRAMPDGGTLTIRCTQSKDPAGGDMVSIAYRDTGPGIAAARRSDVFSPAVSLSAEGEGVDDGLAISSLIAREHGGYLDVDNEAGNGATFRVVLPV